MQLDVAEHTQEGMLDGPLVIRGAYYPVGRHVIS